MTNKRKTITIRIPNCEALHNLARPSKQAEELAYRFSVVMNALCAMLPRAECYLSSLCREYDKDQLEGEQSDKRYTALMLNGYTSRKALAQMKREAKSGTAKHLWK